MGYIEENLRPDEVVRYRATLHWIIFVPHRCTDDRFDWIRNNFSCDHLSTNH